MAIDYDDDDFPPWIEKVIAYLVVSGVLCNLFILTAILGWCIDRFGVMP